MHGGDITEGAALSLSHKYQTVPLGGLSHFLSFIVARIVCNLSRGFSLCAVMSVYRDIPLVLLKSLLEPANRNYDSCFDRIASHRIASHVILSSNLSHILARHRCFLCSLVVCATVPGAPQLPFRIYQKHETQVFDRCRPSHAQHPRAVASESYHSFPGENGSSALTCRKWGFTSDDPCWARRP